MKKNTYIAIGIVIVVLVLLAGGLYYRTYQTAGPNNLTNGTSTAQTAQLQAVLAKLATHMVLPTGEVPQIGQIDDPVQAAKTQPFVAGAQKGDLLIVYVKALKAIVYSPSRDLIVNVGPVSMNNQAPAGTPTTPTTPTPVKVPVKK